MATSTSAAVVQVPPHAATGARYWLVRAACGFLFGAAIALLEFIYYLPLISAPHELGLASFAALLLTWGGEGILFTLIVAHFEARALPLEMRSRELALVVATGAAVGVLTWQGFVHIVLRDQFGLRLFVEYAGQPTVWTGIMLYHGWLLLFFGGLAAAVHTSHRWRRRMLESLRSAEIARASSQQRLAQAHLDFLRARIDPEALFQRLAELEGLYMTDPAAAERLLDGLVATLREAVAGIRVSATSQAQAALST